MSMNAGIIELESFYEFVRQNPFARKRDRRVFVSYRQLVLKLMSDVPHDPGWYGWLQDHTPIYIGQAREGKTSSLNGRLRALLLDEYVAFWSSVDDMEELFAAKGEKYRPPLMKQNSNSIVWVAQPGCKQGTLDGIEHKLIWDLKPELNQDRRDYSDVELPAYVKVRLSMESAFNVSG